MVFWFVQGYLRAAKCYLMTGNPSLSIDYYRKVLNVEKRNKQAMHEMRISQEVKTQLEAADQALENKEFHKVRH